MNFLATAEPSIHEYIYLLNKAKHFCSKLEGWALILACHKLMAHINNLSTWDVEQEVHKFKVIFDYIASLVLVLANRTQHNNKTWLTYFLSTQR